MATGQGGIRLGADHHLYGNIHHLLRAAGRRGQIPRNAAEFFGPRSLQRWQLSTFSQSAEFTQAARCVSSKGEQVLWGFLRRR